MGLFEQLATETEEFIGKVVDEKIDALPTPAPGKDGEDGTDGEDGLDGDSAYQIWLKLGNQGSEADFIASLKGKDGKDGLPGTSTGTSRPYGMILMDSYPGTDDEKLDAAIADARSRAQIPAIALPDNRIPTFTKSGRELFSGLKIVGSPQGHHNPEQGTKLQTTMVNFRFGTAADPQPWFRGSGNVFNVYFADFAVNGTAGTYFIDQPSGSLYSCEFHSLAFNLCRAVFGLPGRPALMTQVTFSGHWTANNARGQQFTLGGSDNDFWMDSQINIGTGQSPELTGNGDQYYIHLASVSKSRIGFIYASGLNGWNCMRVTGSATSGYGNDFYGGVYEGFKDGANSALANPGNVIRLEGGQGTFHGGNFGQGMSKPLSNHLGLIHITGGDWVFIAPKFYGNYGAAHMHQAGGRLEVIAPRVNSGISPVITKAS